MNVKQLKEELAKYPDHYEVFLADRKTEFKYGLANSVRSEYIQFMEDPGGDPLAEDTVLIIDEA